MKNVLPLTIKIVLMLLVSFGIAQAWWHMWMNRGWVGTPQILHQFVFSDGEASYDNTLLEMWIISFVILMIIYFLFGAIRNRNRSNRLPPAR
jgi:hypothetical protein